MSVAEAFRRAGVAGWMHAADIDTGRETGAGADEPVVLASVFKLPLLAAFYRQVADGLLDPGEQVTVRAGDRTPGSTGLSAMLDDARLSLRDLAYLMMAISDNTAGDILAAKVGLDAVNAMLTELGLTRTRVEQTGGELFAALSEDLGDASPDDPAAVARLRVLDPARTNRGTPREMTRLLGMLWRDVLPGSAEIRRLMGLQVWPHRLSSGFPYDDVAVSGKTGTLPTIRNEVGVVEYPDGGRYAVAVFTRSFSTAAVQPKADAVIGTVARMAIDRLRARG